MVKVSWCDMALVLVGVLECANGQKKRFKNFHNSKFLNILGFSNFSSKKIQNKWKMHRVFNSVRAW